MSIVNAALYLLPWAWWLLPTSNLYFLQCLDNNFYFIILKSKLSSTWHCSWLVAVECAYVYKILNHNYLCHKWFLVGEILYTQLIRKVFFIDHKTKLSVNKKVILSICFLLFIYTLWPYKTSDFWISVKWKKGLGILHTCFSYYYFRSAFFARNASHWLLPNINLNFGTRYGKEGLKYK